VSGRLGRHYGRDPPDAQPARLGLQQCIDKVIFGARRKIRRALVANEYLEEPGLEQ